MRSFLGAMRGSARSYYACSRLSCEAEVRKYGFEFSVLSGKISSQFAAAHVMTDASSRRQFRLPFRCLSEASDKIFPVSNLFRVEPPRRHDRTPVRKHDIEAELAPRRHLRQRTLEPLGRRDAKKSESAALHLRQGGCSRRDDKAHMPAEKRGSGFAA